MQKINKLYIKKDCAYKRIYTWVEGGGGCERKRERETGNLWPVRFWQLEMSQDDRLGTELTQSNCMPSIKCCKAYGKKPFGTHLQVT